MTYQFEPLLPTQNLGELYKLAQSVVTSALHLKNALHDTTAQTLAKLLRAMNSYYSNKIEGHSTHPTNIQQGLSKNFSEKPNIAKLQRLALAHIRAEETIESWTLTDAHFSPFSQKSISAIHATLYQTLAISDRTIESGQVVAPGEWRDVDVIVGRHTAISARDIPIFLKRFEEVYTKQESWDKALIMIAAAHHRLAWIHPFLDGNGRVTRLASHAALYQYFTGGLWSVCRGLARTQNEYYRHLQDADEPRRGDLDGRGNLTEQGLWHFCHYFLSVCLDQVTYMNTILRMGNLRERIHALILFLATSDSQLRTEAVLPLHYLFTCGSLSRTEFKQMTGLGKKVSQNLLSRLLKTGLVESDTPLGPVRFGLPLHALSFYFPDLYPEAATTNMG